MKGLVNFMANSKLIIVEGPQGTGKTTITDFIRFKLNYTNLYRLCGTSDITPSGLEKATKIYDNLVNYIQSLQNQSINLLFDRTFFSEEIYCRLGLKEYSFTEHFNKLASRLNEMNFDIYYITLYLNNTSLFEQRLKREGKVSPDYLKFSFENSIKQQNCYLKLAEEIKEKYKNIKVFTVSNDGDLKITKETILDIITSNK